MLIDEIEITVRGGKGGAGKVSFVGRAGGPDGGDGGKGGDIYIKTTSDLYALSQFLSKNLLQAEDGSPGESNKKSGDKGKDLTLVMPIGTVLIEESGRETELNKLDQREFLVSGGLGGRGNESFKSSANTTPKYAQPGLPGEEKKLKLELRLIADFGLIGLPNAGKSSLLNEITNAKAKIGAYPFTTLEPNLGMLNGKVLADIPGLIEGASQGKGLGHKFLKHVRQVKLILHCISCESENIAQDYEIVRRELQEFNPELLDKEEIIILTKSDLLAQKDLDKKIKILSKTKKQVIPVSIHDWDSLQSLIKTLGKY